MKLSSLLKGITNISVKGSRLVEVKGIVSHSKLAFPGALFIARRGATVDGSEYIEQALASGSSVIVTDLFNPMYENITQVICSDIEQLETQLLGRFYKDPFKDLFMIGVTGTNGKTSTTALLKHCLDCLDCKAGLIGTIANVIGSRRYPALMTTPDKALSYKYLKEMVDTDLKSCAMEVSSHALKQKRLGSIRFDIAVVTNITQDHLDYHKTMNDYVDSKVKLLKRMKKSSKLDEPVVILNLDCPFAPDFIKAAESKVCTYGFESNADYRADRVLQDLDGIAFTLLHEENSYEIKIPLYGFFQVYNALATIAALHQAGFPISNILKALEKAPSIEGRLERVCSKNSRCGGIFVDYAHTPDALQKALLSLRPLCKGKLIVVFGCGGERDQQKRTLMGQIAIKYADFTVVTSDNPRSEDPFQIIQDIITDMNEKSALTVESDRQKAIEKAISIAGESDMVLVAGKGHEAIQDLGSFKLAFKDADVISQACNKSQGVNAE